MLSILKATTVASAGLALVPTLALTEGFRELHPAKLLAFASTRTCAANRPERIAWLNAGSTSNLPASPMTSESAIGGVHAH